MDNAKTELCNTIAGLPTNERHELIREYLASHKVSDRVRNLLESFII